MSAGDDDLRVRPGRIQHGNQGGGRPKSFVGEVTRAARKAGHVGRRFGGGGRRGGRGGGSHLARGRRAALSTRLRSNARRVVVKARVVRQRGARFRSAPLARHIAYLRREGVTKDGAKAHLFDAGTEEADGKAFAERCADDRHHFRFIVSPEDAARMEDLKGFVRDLMADMERDLGTRLDWVGVDHWNTDNPHVHILVRGVADDGRDLVIDRDYISRGLRDRAAGRVTLELGPRSEHEIRTVLENEIGADRWTSLDRALQDVCDEGGGVADLRPGAGGEDPQLRRLLVGRATRLESLGLAEKVGVAQWTLKPGMEATLRDLATRGDIITTMHRAMAREGDAPDVGGFAIHGEQVHDPVIGKLVERGLDDELKGSGYAVIAGIDGRTHHIRFVELDLTGDGKAGAIVETRSWQDGKGKARLSLATRSDLTLAEQVTAPGATWLDRQLVARDPPLAHAGFGAEAREAMQQRAERLVAEGLARQQGQRLVFARNLIDTLRQRDLDQAASRIAAETGLIRHTGKEGDTVAGIYRQRVNLSSGRFAMVDDGLGFQLVPWRPALEQKLGQHVSGTLSPGGSVDWTFGRRRGLGI
ncbi:relaxase/mobilization nuclease domain-containing protein [Komagataeibacter europaeus]|uniref:relaxase/mobilization nuclease domain-containing protein n=1 Tax=Komagataeibacter europaeus TaxID=33995 RepID=UPI000237DEF5|nr:DUF3363 domain-containing protein [Komagataeibacter europaeus]